MSGMIGTVPGAWLNHQVAPAVVLFSFAIAILIAAYWMTITRGGGDSQAVATGNPVQSLFVGVGVGLATGFFGVGGGFLIVPALVMLLGLEMPAAVATSLLVIALNCSAGLAAHGAYGAVEWRLGLGFAAATLFGAWLALPFGKRSGAGSLQRAFAAVLVVVGIGMLAQTVNTFWT